MIEVVRRSPLTALAYVLPEIPLAIGWDALISCLRSYTREELLAMAGEADPDGAFDWSVDEPPLMGSLRAIALTGIPRQRST